MSSRVEALRELLRKRFPESSVGLMPEHDFLSSGIETLDDLLSGGLRAGTLSLVSGGMSSGKTSLALAFAACLSRDHGRVAWLHSGAFSAPSAAHGGVDFEFFSEVQMRSCKQFQQCLDIILREAAFPLVVADWTWPLTNRSWWQRLYALLHRSPSALLILSPPLPQAASLRFLAAIHLHVIRPWRDVLSSPQVEVFLQKSRFGVAGGSVQLTCGNTSGPFPLYPELPGLGQEWNDDS